MEVFAYLGNLADFAFKGQWILSNDRCIDLFTLDGMISYFFNFSCGLGFADGAEVVGTLP